MDKAIVSVRVAGHVAMVTMDGGPNYLSQDMLAELANVMPTLPKRGSITDICLCGRADTFIVGADMPLFVRCLAGGEVDPILSYTRAARAALDHLAQNPKRVIAWVRGPALGAGLELALACHQIVAAPTAKFALPETGLGIYPGMGGTQRLQRRIGRGLAKWMIYTGAIVPAAHALAIGLVDVIHPSATTAEEALTSLDQPPGPPMDRARFDVLEELFDTHDLATLLDAARPMPTDPQAVRALVQLRGKAPIALGLAEQIIDRGATMTLEAGLDEEFSHLAEILATEDARVGLASIGKDRPRFVGR